MENQMSVEDWEAEVLRKGLELHSEDQLIAEVTTMKAKAGELKAIANPEAAVLLDRFQVIMQMVLDGNENDKIDFSDAMQLIADSQAFQDITEDEGAPGWEVQTDIAAAIEHGCWSHGYKNFVMLAERAPRWSNGVCND